MAARDTAARPAPGQMASQLREQLQGLVPDQVGAAVASTADEANARMRQLLDYAMLALEFREPLAQLVRRLTGRTAPESTPPAEHQDKQGALSSVRRHPVLAIGAALGVGLIVYGVLQAGRTAEQRQTSRA